MFEVTDMAVKNLKDYLDQNNVETAVRVALMQGGWSGPSLGLALDEPRESDSTYINSGVTLIVDKELLETCEGIKVDFVDDGVRSGFMVSSAKPVGGGGGGCGSSCGGSSGGCQC